MTGAVLATQTQLDAPRLLLQRSRTSYGRSRKGEGPGPTPAALLPGLEG